MFRPARRMLVAVAVTLGAVSPLPGNASAAAGKAYNACTLFSLDEIRRIGGTAAAGVVNLNIPLQLERLKGGGTYCNVGLVDIQLDPIPIARFDSFRKAAAKKATVIRLTGVGDEAYRFEERRSSTTNVGVLARKGKHTLTLGLTSLDGPEIAPARSSLTALAKAAVAKL